MISDRYVWPDLKKNVALWCRNCIDCQKTKVRRHNITNLQRYPPPSQKFVHINVDLAGPLPTSTSWFRQGVFFSLSTPLQAAFVHSFQQLMKSSQFGTMIISSQHLELS